MFLKNLLPLQSSWSLCSTGLSIFSLGPVAIKTGGHVRVGMEDCIHISKGNLADSNAQMVAKMVRMAEEMEREIATPEDARKILKLN